MSNGAGMIDEVTAAMTRVLGHSVTLREDTPLDSFGPWPALAVLLAHALHQATGLVLSDEVLTQAQTAGDLAAALESAQ